MSLGATRDQIQKFAEDAFIQFAGLQGLGLLLLIPALVAGTISDEYQRKTLHYLLASRLSSAEIVLGKLGARLVHVIAFVALGLPIVSLLALYGGLNPVNIFFVYVGTATVVVFAAGFSILISILARRPRDAILATYFLGALWLLVPPQIEGISSFLEGPLVWVPPVNDSLIVTNPIRVWSAATSPYGGGRWAFGARMPFTRNFMPFEWHFGIMSVTLCCSGLVLTAVAVGTLRPLRGSAWPGAKPETGWFSRLHARYRRIVDARAAASAHAERAAGHAQESPAVRRGSHVLERALHPDGRRPAMAGQQAGRAFLHRVSGLLPL